VTRAEAPKLYALVDEVARALDTPSIDVLGIDHDWNASWAVLGLPRRRVLTLGLPLWTALEPNERVALLAHELAHERNGDARRGLFVHGAVSALAELYFVLAPGREDPDEPVEFVDAVVGALLWVVSRPLWALLLLEVHLLLRDSQRAEYLADRRAASVAGTDAAVSLAEKMLLAPSLAMVAQRTAHAGDSAGDLFDELAATIGSVPARERERRRRVARLEAARLDATHPPTAKRIELLESRRREPPRVRLDPVRAQFIDEELRALRPKLQRALVADYLDSIYA
jgi:Zn-dependent protease with chaperone function